MNRTIIAKVSADGVLHLEVPLGAAGANAEVKVTIETLPPPLSDQEWHDFIEQTAGKWQGPFERPDQGDYEKRDEL